MVVKKHDFQKTAGFIQEFLSKLSCEESTAELRDSMNLVLFYLQKYYKKLRSRSISSGTSPRFHGKTLSGSLIFNGGVSPVSPACGIPDQFEWKWYNLESPRLSASLGTNEFSSLPLVLQAAKSGDSELLKELIDKDPAVVQQVDGLGRNAAMYCVHGNTPAHTECLELLINADCDLDHQANDNTTALHVAAYRDNTAAVTLLLRNKASHHIEDHQSRTPLHWAAASPSVDNLKSLLQVGGSLYAVDSEGLTPAMWACYFDQPQNLQVIHHALSRIDPQEDAIFKDTDCYGQSVMHWSVKGAGSLECLEALLSPHSAILRDNDGKTVLHTAAEKGNAAACELILEVRGNMEGLRDTDNMKRTPAHLAAICGQGEVVNCLLDRGADLLLKDSFGASAVDYIHNKQLTYCGMVLRAHSQCNEQNMAKNESVPSNPGSQDNHTTSPRPQSSAHSTETVQFQNDTTDITDKQHRESLCGQNNDVSELHGFDVEGGSVDTENEENHQKTKHDPRNGTKTADNKGDNKKAKQKNKCQSTLTRQAGFQNENDPREMLEAPSFDLRTEDGDILVVVSNLDTEGDGQEHVIDIEEGDIDIDCEENLEYSSTRLQQGHGSASSVYSEPDNADNCSISVGLSVSSLGSDNEEELNDLEIEEHAKEDKEEEEQRHQTIPESHKSSSHHSRQLPSPQDPIPSPRHPQKLAQLPSAQAEKSPPYVDDNYVEYEQDNIAVASKKKKDKNKKKKQKGPSTSELVAPLPPPRGMVPPNNSLSPLGVTKLGALDPRGIKPAPWEHGSLGPLRQAPPEPAPPVSPRMAKKGFPHPGEAFDRNENVFERPRTPEPLRSPWDMGGHHPLQPSPPDAPFRGPMEGGVHDREMGYMDIIGRGAKMESWTGKNIGGVMPHGPPGPRPPGHQTYALHGPIPRPPQH